MLTVLATAEFEDWLDGLRDRRAKKKVLAWITNAEEGNLGDVQPVGGGVSERRIHYGPGYRIYFKRRGSEIIVLLAGGDKSTQAQDILNAKALAKRE